MSAGLKPFQNVECWFPELVSEQNVYSYLTFTSFGKMLKNRGSINPKFSSSIQLLINWSTLGEFP